MKTFDTPASRDFLGRSRQSSGPRVHAVHLRGRPEPRGDLEGGKAGATPDVEHALAPGERHVLEHQQSEHGRPQRHLVVDGGGRR
jgi:hypothetical protein